MSRKAIPLLWSLLLLVFIFVFIKALPHYSGMFNFAGISAGSLLFGFIGLVPGLLLAGIPLMLVLLYTLEVLPVTQTWLANNLEVSLVKTLVSVALGYVLVTSLERKQFSK